MENRIRENGITYVLAGDYYVPEVQVTDKEYTIGKYGRMHRDYLKRYHPGRYNNMIMHGTLWNYLSDRNEQAQDRLQLIMEQMQEAESVTEKLKAYNQIAWVRAMNSIYNRSEEIVLRELVYRRMW